MAERSYAQVQPPNSVEEFREICRERITNSKVNRPIEGQIGEVIYAPIGALRPGQLRFCFKRMLRNLSDLINKSKDFTLKYDGGLSAYGPKDALKGVLHQGQIYIVDGHHHLFASILANSHTVPVQIVDDLSYVSPNLFFIRMVQEEYSYPYDIQGDLQVLPHLCDLVNDPYLDVVRGLMAKTKVQNKDGQWIFGSIKGSKTPAIIKINDDIPFLELLGADALRRARFLPKDLNNLSMNEIKEAHQILTQDALQSRLSEVLIPKRILRMSKLEIKKTTLRFLNRPNACRKYLSKT